MYTNIVVMNKKKYVEDPRVHISTRLSVKNKLLQLKPEEKTLSKKLLKLVKEEEERTNAISK
jgi:hypothetical protein